MNNKAALLATSAALAFTMAATPALAQSSGYGDVIVTATKRVQTLQETPVAVTVTSADVIEKARIADIGDLQSVVPTLRVSQLQNSGNTSFSLRGFGNGTNNVGIEPAIGVFIDGVYRSRAAAAINNLPNLERVEVLPGPQSTLFGKNASGGVISIVTSAPSFEKQGYIEAGLGNNNLFEASGYFTNAITDELAFSIGGGFETADGYFDVVGAPDNNEVNRTTLRGQLLAEPSDALTLRFIADYNTIDENCCGTALAIVGPLSASNRDSGFLPSSTDPFSYTTFANNESENDIKDMGASLQVDYDLGQHTLTSITALRQNDWYYDSDSDFSSIDFLGTVFQDVDTQTFTQELRFASDLGGQFEYMLGGYYFAEDIELNSGALWGDDARGLVAISVGEANPAVPAAASDAVKFGAGISTFQTIAALTGTNSDEFFASGLGTRERFDQEDRALSIFGNFDYKPTDRLTLSAGINYTEADKDLMVDTVVNDGYSDIEFLNFSVNGDGLLTPADGNGAFILSQLAAAQGGTVTEAQASMALALRELSATFDALVSSLEGLQGVQFLKPSADFPNSVENGSTSDSDVTWSLRAAYEVNDNWNVYASAATGFKASSWNLTRDSAPLPSDVAALQTSGEYEFSEGTGTRFAAPEESMVFEIGAKARFEQGAFNVSIFDQTIENFQTAIFVGTAFQLNNAGETNTKGIEFDSVYTPTDAWQINFGGALIDAEYVSFPISFEGDDGLPVDLTGERPSGVPEIALSTAVTYNHDFANGYSGYIRAEHQFEDETKVVDNLPDSITREVNSLNASMGLDFGNGVGVQVWGRNILNDEYFTSGFPTPLFSDLEKSAGVPFDFRSASVYPNQPATYGASLRYSF